MARWLNRIYLDLPSPFGLARPDAGWLNTIEQYDPDLVIYPSQKDYVYRLCRLAKKTGGMNGKMFAALPGLHPDTRVCLQHHLVAVTTIPVGAISVSPSLIVEQLYWRDLWAHGGADAVDDRLNKGEELAEAAIDQRNEDELRVRARAMRIAYLRRTGARVSLVSPLRPAAAASLGEPNVTLA